MPLSDREQQILEEIEKNLYDEDPRFARATRRAGPRYDGSKRARLGALLFVVGLGTLLLFFVTQAILVGVLRLRGHGGGYRARPRIELRSGQLGTRGWPRCVRKTKGLVQEFRAANSQSQQEDLEKLSREHHVSPLSTCRALGARARFPERCSESSGEVRWFRPGGYLRNQVFACSVFRSLEVRASLWRVSLQSRLLATQVAPRISFVTGIASLSSNRECNPQGVVQE